MNENISEGDSDRAVLLMTVLLRSGPRTKRDPSESPIRKDDLVTDSIGHRKENTQNTMRKTFYMRDLGDFTQMFTAQEETLSVVDSLGSIKVWIMLI